MQERFTPIGIRPPSITDAAGTHADECPRQPDLIVQQVREFDEGWTVSLTARMLRLSGCRSSKIRLGMGITLTVFTNLRFKACISAVDPFGALKQSLHLASYNVSRTSSPIPWATYPTQYSKLHPAAVAFLLSVGFAETLSSRGSLMHR